MCKKETCDHLNIYYSSRSCKTKHLVLHKFGITKPLVNCLASVLLQCIDYTAMKVHRLYASENVILYPISLNRIQGMC